MAACLHPHPHQTLPPCTHLHPSLFSPTLSIHGCPTSSTSAQALHPHPHSHPHCVSCGWSLCGCEPLSTSVPGPVSLEPHTHPCTCPCHACAHTICCPCIPHVSCAPFHLTPSCLAPWPSLCPLHLSLPVWLSQCFHPCFATIPCLLCLARPPPVSSCSSQSLVPCVSPDACPPSSPPPSHTF